MSPERQTRRYRWALCDRIWQKKINEINFPLLFEFVSESRDAIKSTTENDKCTGMAWHGMDWLNGKMCMQCTRFAI